MGTGMSAPYADSIFGHHETDNILDSYLNPEWHYQKAKEPYVTYNHGVIKILPEENGPDGFYIALLKKND